MENKIKVVKEYNEYEQGGLIYMGVPLLDMIHRVNKEPQLKMIYSGIKENSLGIFYGPSKSGKTILCENLGLSIASGEKEYLGTPIDIDNRMVLVCSLEEHYRNRTERNKKQATVLARKYGGDWMSNFIVVDEKMPRYISSDKDWEMLTDLITATKPGFVIIDSMTHLHHGSIEDSSVAKELMKRLRTLTESTKTTIAVIHHTHKMYDRPLSLDTIAGSRVIAQELDFMIGLNRTMDGRHYMKDVAFRYSECNSDKVKTFRIDNDCWLQITGTSEEMKLIAAPDGRKDDTNMEKLFEFLLEVTEDGAKTIPFNVIEEKFVATGEMTKPTAYTNLQKLINKGDVFKPAKNTYGLVA